ncbi:hypothetical protein, partial [Klebsiella pneumoniae]|uniref:hypothetical protein n=1 Tax=Klebsiella pneumoniae TaxID=573 RepID=UPI001C131A60
TPSYTKSVSWQHHRKLTAVALSFMGYMYGLFSHNTSHIICMIPYLQLDKVFSQPKIVYTIASF